MNETQQITTWRFLIVEDDSEMARQISEILPSCVSGGDSVEIEICRRFGDAALRLQRERFDMIILDLKDEEDDSDDDEANPAGLQVFEALKKTRFIPVVFYTALAHLVRAEETSFVRVVMKTDGIMKVKEEVEKVMGTRLPMLTRHLDSLQRDYMWDFVSAHWQAFDDAHQKADLVYLLARRLAATLQDEARHQAGHITAQAGQAGRSDSIYPMEMYICPPASEIRMAGDLLKEVVGEEVTYWILLTPSCDFVQGKAEHIVLAKCEQLKDQKEYVDWVTNQNVIVPLKELIRDNRVGKRGDPPDNPMAFFKLQPERFKFLPGTFLMPDLVVDFQQLRSIHRRELDGLEAFASLDSPFAEAVVGRFTRFFGRVGTPDIEHSSILDRLTANIPRATPTP